MNPTSPRSALAVIGQNGELLPTPDGTLSSVLRAVTTPDGVEDSEQATEWQNRKYNATYLPTLKDSAAGNRIRCLDVECGPVVLMGKDHHVDDCNLRQWDLDRLLLQSSSRRQRIEEGFARGPGGIMATAM